MMLSRRLLVAACGFIGIPGCTETVPTLSSSDSNDSDIDEVHAPPPLALPRVYAGLEATCVVIEGTNLRCWGQNTVGNLGFGLSEARIGDDEPASVVPLLAMGAHISHVSLDGVSCLLLDSGLVRCWGGGPELGFPWEGELGDDETLLEGPPLDFGDDEPIQVATGMHHVCALFDGGGVKCWGDGKYGALGYASTEDLGDDPGEGPADLPFVDLGEAATSLSAGPIVNCAVLQSGAVRCWGADARGALGVPIVGGDSSIGDDEHPSSVEAIHLAGGRVTQVAQDLRQVCALHEEGTVSCWGETGPWLGYGPSMSAVGSGYGDDEHPSTLGVIDFGMRVSKIAVGDAFSCALLENGNVKCWGASDWGQLGYGNQDFVGYAAPASEVEAVELGGKASDLQAGKSHVCAMLLNGVLRCWGHGFVGQLGAGSPANIGDDETPAQVGGVPFR